MARDCTVNKDPNAVALNGASPPPSKGGFDSEYASLMAELGEGNRGPAGDGGKPLWAGPSAGHDITGGGTNIPPWRRPEVWQTPGNNQPQTQQGGYRPPQGYGVGGYSGVPATYGGGAQQWGVQAGYSQPSSYPQQPQQDYSASYAQYYQSQYAQQQISN
jgi:splicing factor 1